MLEGVDSLDLLERLLTQSIGDMQTGEVRRSFLCDPLGRAIDHLLVWRLDDQILLSGLAGRGEELRAVLSESVSWKEDVRITVGDDAISDLWLVGDAGIRSLVGIGIDPDELVPRRAVAFGPAFVAVAEPIDGHPTHRLVSPRGAEEGLIAALVEQGAVRIPDGEWNGLRIRAGVLGGGAEVDGTTIPFELDGEADVSLRKGCYPGQEILARMESRGKLARTLVRLRTETGVTVGRHDVDGGRPILVTSAAEVDGADVAMALCHPSMSPPFTLGDGTRLIAA